LHSVLEALAKGEGSKEWSLFESQGQGTPWLSSGMKGKSPQEVFHLIINNKGLSEQWQAQLKHDARIMEGDLSQQNTKLQALWSRMIELQKGASHHSHGGATNHGGTPIGKAQKGPQSPPPTAGYAPQ
jgi:hypothetical protein